MMVSPFTFYRGAAKIMAADLKHPDGGPDAQLCGDAHLSNFGLFASPERTLLFDLNDFDETLPGPFEYDVKRMAASFTIAGRNNGFSKADRGRRRWRRCGPTGRRWPGSRRCGRWTSGTPTWTRMADDRDPRHGGGKKAGREEARQEGKRRRRRRRPRTGEKTPRRRTPGTACRRCPSSAKWSMAGTASSASRRSSCPSVTWPQSTGPPTSSSQVIHDQFREYRATLQADRRQLLERFEIVDMARKVVGVGSVGTRAFIALLQGRDARDPLFLQIKEATASVLEDHLPKSRFAQPGERVVQGQRMMQAVSDIFLGWTKGAEAGPLFLLAPAAGHERLGEVESMSPGGWPSTRASAGGRWPGRTPDPGTRSRSPPTWAAATPSTSRSPTSRSATPTRTSKTSKPSSRQSDPDGSKR